MSSGIEKESLKEEEEMKEKEKEKDKEIEAKDKEEEDKEEKKMEEEEGKEEGKDEDQGKEKIKEEYNKKESRIREKEEEYKNEMDINYDKSKEIDLSKHLQTEDHSNSYPIGIEDSNDSKSQERSSFNSEFIDIETSALNDNKSSIQVHYIYILWNFKSEECSNIPLKLTMILNDRKNPSLNCPLKIHDDCCEKINPNKRMLTTQIYPHNSWTGDIEIKFNSEISQSRDMKNMEICSPRRTINRKFEHIFGFDLKVVSKSKYNQHVVPFISESHSLQELSIYTYFLLKSTNWEQKMLDLIDQFNENYKNHIAHSPSNANLFFLVVDEFLSKNSSLSVDQLYILICLISCISDSMIQYREVRFCESSMLLQNYNKMQNLPLGSHFIEGLVHLMIFNKKENKKDWCSILNYDLNDSIKFSILDHFLKDLLLLKIPLREEENLFIIENIGVFKIKEWLKLFEHLALNTMSFKEFLENLEKLVLKENLVNEKKECLNLISVYCQKNIETMNDVVEFIKVVSGLNEKFKHWTYQDNIKTIIGDILNSNKEKKEFQMYSFQLIFNDFNDTYFVDDNLANKLSNKLMEEFNVPLYKICDIFGLKNFFLKHFEKWLDNLSKSKINEIISNFEKEILPIKDNNDLKDISKIFVEKLLSICKSMQIEFLDCAPFIAGCENDSLNIIYIETDLKHENEKIKSIEISESKKKDMVLKKLFKFYAKYPNNKILCALIKELLNLMKFEDSEFEIKSALFERPDKQIIWKAIIDSFDQYKSFEYSQSLIDQLSAIGDQLLQKNITLMTIDFIKKQDEIQILTIANFLQKSLMISKKREEQNFSVAIKSIIAERDLIEKHFESYSKFVNHFQDMLEGYETIEEIFQNFKKQYKDIQLSEFSFPCEMILIIEITQEIGKAIDSFIFNNYYFRKCKTSLSSSSSRWKIKIIASKFKEAYYKMIKNLTNLFRNTNQYPMKKIIKIFNNIKSIEDEVIILSSLVPAEEINKRTLENCLRNYQEHETIVAACNGIIKLKEIAVEIDKNAFSLCSDYISYSKKLMNLSIGEYLNISTGVNELFSPTTSKEIKEVVINTLNEIWKSIELVLFLLDLRKDEIDHMKESVNDFENVFVSTQIVFYLENLWDCLRDIRKFCLNFSDLCNLFTIERDDGKNFKEVALQLQICYPQLCAITELHTETNCKEEAKKKHISEIGKNSTFTIKFENGMYDVDLKYASKKYNFDIAALNELKSRAQLIMHTFQSSDFPKDENLNYFPNFVGYINSINSTIAYLNDLYQNGYPDLYEIMNSEYGCINGEYESAKKLNEDVLVLYKVWEIDLRDAYSNYYWLTFLCGNQFWILEDYIINPCCESKIEAKNILRFMGKKTEINYENRYQKKRLPGERFVELAKFLNETENIAREPFSFEIKKSSKDKIVFLYTNKYLNGIFSIYKYYTGSFPEAHQVLFCKSSTHWKELRAYLYRYLKDPYNNFYSIINYENLSLENQIKFKTLFNEFLESGKIIKSGLAIITASSKCYLSQYFKSLTVPNVTRFSSNEVLSDDEVKSFIKDIDKNTFVLTSSCSGLGKTTTIKYLAKQCSMNLISFPIGGDINYSEFCKMISQLNIIPEISILHLNLSYTNNPTLLNEVLINICLFRNISTSENIFVLNKETPIYIEVANTFGNSLYKSVEYLSFFTDIHFEGFKIDDLIIPDNIDDPMQNVGRYLYLYENKLLNNESELNERKTVLEVDMKKLLNKYFIPNQIKTEQITYTQLHIFISILNRLIVNFEESPFSPQIMKIIITDLKENELEFIAMEYTNLRPMIFECILNSTKEFTTKCISNVKEIQEKSLEKLSKNQIDETNEMYSLVSKYQNNIKWESSNHFHLLFLGDGSFIPIYRDLNQVPENFKKLIFLQNNYNVLGVTLAKMIKAKNFDIDDYSKMTHTQLLEKLNTYNKYKANLKELYQNDDYIITPDNFLKMNLIYLRVYSGLPVIIMGETGCGKTSLIQFLVRKVLGRPINSNSQDCLYTSSGIEEAEITDTGNFVKISVHAGTTSEYIRNKMLKLIDKAEAIGRNDKLWIFFDEFNTTDSIGMICEIMCERMLDGKDLPQNMAFLGACNPYRVSSKKTIQENVGFGKDKRIKNVSKLVHVVKPLPETMIDYVWDFGTLTHEDARIYISTMLDKIQSQHKELFVRIICLAHKYFQEEEDVSSVSLRDVSRFVDLYIWFRNSICYRCAESPEKYKGSVIYSENSMQIEFAAGILSFSHCYYLRIASELSREIFLNKITDSLYEPNLINVHIIKEIIEIEQNDYISRMELPKGTALNKALKENIFTIIPCIVNRIPVFICGKPGCSKSLSVQLIFSNLRGKKSNDPYFRTLPELVMVHFQGSETCKSEGIIKVFGNAGRYPKIGHGVLPVIVFDEIGLAELSNHNPLKVLHSYLEKENIRVGFIGISNWRLDASKMNRALYLARPDPDENDLELTALSIYRSYSKNEAYEHVIVKLTKAYAGLKKQTKETEIANFYGLRDFYHLIKNVSANFAEKDISTSDFVLKCVKTGIERNFGGTIHGTAIMCSLFNEYHKISLPEINTSALDLINDNLNDKNARYLMLIGKPDIATFILDKYLKLNDRRIIIGSSLPNDANQDNYGFECLNDIILYMELGISIILKDMNNIYSSLYDLFNQNFAVQGSGDYERKYCNISLGANFNPRCYVNSKFHAITLMSPDDVEKADAPFLNRFEKHWLSIDKLLSKKQVNLLERIEGWISSFFIINSGQEIVSINKNHLFPIYNNDTLALLILFNTQEKKQLTLEKCGEILLEIAPSDILILLEIISIDPERKENIKNTWNELHKINFKDTIKSMIEGTSEFDKLIAFTYDKRISGNLFNEDNDKKIIIKEMVVYNSKQELTKELKEFYKNEEKEVLILEIDFGEECSHLPLLKFLIDKLNSENPSLKKKFCIVVHIKRNIKYSSNIMIFESWKMKMFDYLTPNSFEITNEILSSSTKSLILSDKIFDYKKEIEYLVEKCMLSFKVEISSGKNYEYKSYLSKIIRVIRNDSEFCDHIKDKIWEYLQKTDNIKQDWKNEIFLNSKLIDDSSNLHEAIAKSLGMEIESALQLIIYVLEDKSALLSYIDDFTRSYAQFNNFRKQIWLDIFKSMNIDKNIALQKLNQGNLLKYEYDLYFPFSRMDYKAINNAFNMYKISEMNNNPIQTAFEKFSEEYHQLSIYKENINFNGEHSQLQDLYFNDLASIYLKENLLSLDHKKLILTLLKIMFYDDKLFEEKLLSFMQLEDLGVLICHAIDVLPEFAEKVTKILEEFLNNIDSFNGGQAKNVEESNKMWEIASNSIYKFMAENMGPHLFNKEGFGVLDYSLKAEKLYNILTEIEVKQRTTIDTLDALEFWVLFSKLIAKSNGNPEHLWNQSYQASVIKTEEELFIYDKGFADSVFRIIEINYKTSPHYYKFMSSFLKLLVNRNPDYIEKVAKELEKEEFWQYSTKIMNIIEDQIEIWNSITELKEAILKDKNAEFVLINNDCGYLEATEDALENQGIFSNFGIILCENMENTLKGELIEGKDKFYTNGLDDLKFFRYFLKKANYNELEFPHIKKLISLILVKNYLDIYCDELSKNNSGNDILSKIGNALTKRDIKDTLKLYCVKKILVIKNYDFGKFMLEYGNLPWIKRIKELEELTKPKAKLNLDSFLVFFGNLDIYKRNVKLLRNILNKIGDESENDKILDEIQSPDQKLALGIALLNEIFSIYSKDKEMNKNIIIWFHRKEDMIQNSLGKEFYKLFCSFINNFPVGSELRLEPETPEIDLHRILTILGIFIAALSYSQHSNPISSIFFNENGILDNIIERFNSRYIFGAEPNPLHKHTLEIYDNFDSIINTGFDKNYARGSVYKCSEDCDYVYIVTKCGGPTQNQDCPFCGRKIGGSNHKLVERAGHVNFTDSEARAFLTEAVSRHRNEAETGLKYFGSLLGETNSIRSLKPISYLTEHLVLSSIIFVLNQLGSINDATLELLINSSKLHESANICLRKSVKEDYNKLLELSGSNTGYLWVYNLISTLDQLMFECNYDPLSPMQRDEFEVKFEDKLIILNQNPQNSIAKYSTSLKTRFENLYSFKDYLCEFYNLDNDEKDENYPYIELFRIKGELSLRNMKNQFLLNPKANDFRLINIFLNNFEDIGKIESLYPIIEFTNKLRDIYNHKILRTDAYRITIGDTLDSYPDLKPLFDRFLDAWTHKGIENLHYGCKELEPIYEFTYNSKLAYFLVDNKALDGGIYMAAALIELGEIQNKYLSQITSIIYNNSRSQEEQKDREEEMEHKALIKYPLQKLKEQNMISLNIDDTELLKACSITNPKYGKGRDIIYDFERMQKLIIKKLLLAKLIDTSRLDLIQYQLELLNTTSEDSGLLMEIQKIIKQIPLEQGSFYQVELFFSELEKEAKVDYATRLKDIYTSFNNVLCYLRYSKRKYDYSIMDFCRELNSSGISNYLKERTKISEIKLENVISLYHIVEAKYFPFAKASLYPEYKPNEKDSLVEEYIIELIKEIDRSPDQYPTKSQIEDALMRFIIRNSTANLQPEDSLSTYIVRNDFWDLDVDQWKIENLGERFPENIQLSYSLTAYQSLYAKNHRITSKKVEAKNQEPEVSARRVSKPRNNWKKGRD